MDKKTIFAFLLIGFILIVTQTDFYRDKILKLPPKPVVTETQPDSSFSREEPVRTPKTRLETTPIKKSDRIVPQPDGFYREESELASLLNRDINTRFEDVVIEADLYTARINPKGAVVSSWKLNNFNYNGNESVELIEKEDGNLGFFFINQEDTLYTNNAYFKPNKQAITFEQNNEVDSVRFVLDLGNNRQLIKTFTFYRSEYIFDLDIAIKELASEFDKSQYFLTWQSGLKYTELDYSNNISKEDIEASKAYVYQGESKEELKLPAKPYQTKARSDFSGVVDWAGIRTKYFAMLILPDKEDEIEPELIGKTTPLYRDPDLKDRVKKEFSILLKNKISPSDNVKSISQHFRVYLGPLDYYIIKDYHPTLAKIMDFGFTLFRPFAKLVLKSFIFLHKFIPNYGIVLIVFSILVKILVWPLTRKSYASMQRMQTLQPKMAELKEKYAKEPQRMNKETMKLYKQEGVNPVGGCLPQLIQMPLLIAIFIVFRNTIELRDASFFWWITDLSAPDTIYKLPFSIPFYGNFVNILPIVMGITMFWQQKMTMKDPKQKMMVYFMPIFFTLIFNSFPSGLNLYYALFNVFSIAQQKWSPEKKDQPQPVVTKKVPVKTKQIKGKGNRHKKG
jgi:YidC/Oxa1 family membrane protein insertase